MNSNIPKLSIGFPLFNAEFFLKKRLDSILSQSFTDYELIISDNGSTDNTHQICKEYSEKDSRIKYFHHDKNRGGIWNFNFVLEKSVDEFFVWASVDDLWKKDFLEKNINILNNNFEVVGCISKVETYGELKNERNINNKFGKNVVNSTRGYFSKFGTYPANGSYEKKVRTYLKVNSAQSLYSVFRTSDLKKSFVNENISAVDLAMILNILKYGNLFVLDEVLCYFYNGGISSKGKIETLVKTHGKKSILFPHYTFMKWFWKNIGVKLFFKNLDLIYKMNLGAFLAIIYDLTIKKTN